MLYLCLITPLLGSLKNYVKYKQFNLLVFIRTFYIYALIQFIIKTNNIYLILILERWFFFGFKVIRSLLRNDYMRNRNKYIAQYRARKSTRTKSHTHTNT